MSRKSVLRRHTGETAQRLSERVPDHNDRDAKSHLLTHAIKKWHKYPKIEDFNVLSKGDRRKVKHLKYNTLNRQLPSLC